MMVVVMFIHLVRILTRAEFLTEKAVYVKTNNLFTRVVLLLTEKTQTRNCMHSHVIHIFRNNFSL